MIKGKDNIKIQNKKIIDESKIKRKISPDIVAEQLRAEKTGIKVGKDSVKGKYIMPYLRKNQKSK